MTALLLATLVGELLINPSPYCDMQYGFGWPLTADTMRGVPPFMAQQLVRLTTGQASTAYEKDGLTFVVWGGPEKRRMSFVEMAIATAEHLKAKYRFTRRGKTYWYYPDNIKAAK